MMMRFEQELELPLRPTREFVQYTGPLSYNHRSRLLQEDFNERRKS